MTEKPIRCLITAGPTREYFDPVRFISNPSSGKMGYAVAEAALAQGWSVDLVSGPVTLAAPEGSRVTSVMTGAEMFEAVERLFSECDVLIMSAAVCDMKPKHFMDHKVKKGALGMTLEMESTIDILKTISQQKQPGQTLVGFAAETNDVEAYAQKKMAEKNLDWIVANQVGGANNAFESDSNSILLLGREGQRVSMGPESKTQVALELIEYLAKTF